MSSTDPPPLAPAINIPETAHVNPHHSSPPSSSTPSPTSPFKPQMSGSKSTSSFPSRRRSSKRGNTMSSVPETSSGTGHVHGTGAGYQRASGDESGVLQRTNTHLSRVSSKPPIVTPFGGCCPDDDGEGDSIGFKPVRSQEEAAARDARRNRSRAYSSARQASLAASNEDGTQPSTRPNIARSNSEDTIASRELVDGIRVLRSRSFSHGAAEKGARMKDESQYESPIDDEEFMVRFDPGDPANPKNWSSLYRWYLTAAGSMLVLNSTFASSAPSGIVGDLERYFGFSQEVAVLTISLFVAGYCVGPLLWGPLSESYGRRPIFIIAYIFYIGFTVGCALSRNTASILIFRLLSGIFAACPLTNAGALLADIWDADRRGIAMAFFSLAPFAGPALGPIVGGFIFVTGTNWRWLFWVLTLFAGFCGLLILFTIPETYAPILLCHKAKEMRRETGQLQWWAPLEKAEKDLKDVARDILFKPFKILFAEPMLLAITVYMSFVYGCIYLLFEAYPIVFMEGHGFNAGVNGLMFLGLFIGGCLSTLLYLCFFNARYVKKAHHHAPEPTPPEYRLEPAMLCSPLFAIAFFWFGWTSYPSILWVSPCFAGGLLGFAVLGIFVSLFNYIVDTYLWAAASALSANTVCRSVFGAVFPLFATQMYRALNPRWASTLLGFVALVMVPIPFALYKYGPTLRAKSKFSPNKKT